MEVELAIKSGHVEHGATALRMLLPDLAARGSRRLRSFAVLLQAMLSFCMGRVHDTRRLANTIIETFPSEVCACSSAAVLAARAGIVLGDHTNEAARTSVVRGHDELFLRAVDARACLISCGYREAYERSLETFEASHSSEMMPVAAYSAATIALCYGTENADLRDKWALTALHALASCGSAFDIAKDLFQFGPMTTPRSFLTSAPKAALTELYRCLAPASPLNSVAAFGDLTAELIHAIITHTAHGRVSTDVVERLSELAYDAARKSGGVAPVANELRALAQFGEFLKSTVPAPRQGSYGQRFISSAGIIVRMVTRELSYRRLRALSLVS